MAHNLCYSTLVMDTHKYSNIPGIEYEQFGDHRFAQNVPSVLPAILNDLAFPAGEKGYGKRDVIRHEGGVQR